MWGAYLLLKDSPCKDSYGLQSTNSRARNSAGLVALGWFRIFQEAAENKIAFPMELQWNWGIARWLFSNQTPLLVCANSLQTSGYKDTWREMCRFCEVYERHLSLLADFDDFVVLLDFICFPPKTESFFLSHISVLTQVKLLPKSQAVSNPNCWLV